MLQEITLPKLTNCTILNIRSSTTSFLALHCAIILLNNLCSMHTGEIENQGIQELRQSMQKLKDANIQATVVMEKWIDQSKNEHPFEHQLNPMTQYWDNESIEDDKEEEELQSQEMVRGQYMIDEDASSNSYHEHVQATTTPRMKKLLRRFFVSQALRVHWKSVLINLEVI